MLLSVFCLFFCRTHAFTELFQCSFNIAMGDIIPRVLVCCCAWAASETSASSCCYGGVRLASQSANAQTHLSGQQMLGAGCQIQPAVAAAPLFWPFCTEAACESVKYVSAKSKRRRRGAKLELFVIGYFRRKKSELASHVPSQGFLHLHLLRRSVDNCYRTGDL